MVTRLLSSVPVLPEQPFETKYSNENSSLSTISSSQTSSHDEYLTPRSSIQNDEILSDSESSSIDSTLTDDSEDENYVNNSSDKRVQFNVSLLVHKVETNVKLEDDEAEFFVDNSPEPIKPMRKRDKIRAIFKRKFHRSHSDTLSITSDDLTVEWNEVFVNSLVSMHNEAQNIITGLDEIDQQSMIDDSLSETSEHVITAPRLSFRERQRAKIEIMRMAKMLHPPSLLTYDKKESPYPYTDIVEVKNFTLHSIVKSVPSEQNLIQHKPFRHRKFRYRTQRGILRIRRDLEKLKHDLYGRSSFKSHQELLSLDVQNYRNRLEKSLLEVRQQIIEYDRIHSSTNNHHSHKSISQIIENLKPLDPVMKASIEDYRTKLRPTEYIEKKQNDLISAPFIPRRARYRPENTNKDNNDHLIDTRFNPTTFVDLNDEAKIFFDGDLPFWDESLPLKSTLPSPSPPSQHIEMPPKVGVWDRMTTAFKTKQKNLRETKSKIVENSNNDLVNQSNEKNDEFYDCTSSSLQQRPSPKVSIPIHEQSSISYNSIVNNDCESVEF